MAINCPTAAGRIQTLQSKQWTSALHLTIELHIVAGLHTLVLHGRPLANMHSTTCEQMLISSTARQLITWPSAPYRHSIALADLREFGSMPRCRQDVGQKQVPASSVRRHRPHRQAQSSQQLVAIAILSGAQ